jgi:hypothetical protein
VSGGEVLRGFVHDLGFAIDGSRTVWRTSVRARLPVVVSPADRFDALQAENKRLRDLLGEARIWVPHTPGTVGDAATNGLSGRIISALTGDTP